MSRSGAQNPQYFFHLKMCVCVFYFFLPRTACSRLSAAHKSYQMITVGGGVQQKMVVKQ